MSKHLEEQTVKKVLQKHFNDDTRDEFSWHCSHKEEWVTLSSNQSVNGCEECINDIIKKS